MDLKQIKNELQEMDVLQLEEISSFILDLQCKKRIERAHYLAQLLDDPDQKWVSLDSLIQSSD